jgi:hypothetical protein
MAAMPYPAYEVRTSGFRRRPALPDGGGALSGLQSAPAACGMTEVAVKRRPDKRSAIRQKCAAQKKTAPLARFSVTDYYF